MRPLRGGFVGFQSRYGSGPGMFNLADVAEVLPPLTFRGAFVDNSNLTTYTFSNVFLGRPFPGRRIFVAVCGYDNTQDRRFSSLTIGGVSATLHVSVGNEGQWIPTGIYSALVPDGIAGDIVVTFNAGLPNCNIAVWEAHGLKNSSPTATDSQQNGVTQTLSLNTPDNGIVIGYVAWTIPGSTASWSGATEVFDELTGENSDAGIPIRHTGAHAVGVAAATPHSLTATLSGSALNRERGVALSWA